MKKSMDLLFLALCFITVLPHFGKAETGNKHLEIDIYQFIEFVLYILSQENPLNRNARPAEPRCIEGMSYYDGCNNCFCGGKYNFWSCDFVLFFFYLKE